MAHVGREPDLPLDPRLHRVGHVVERAGEAGEVGVAGRLEAGAEPAGRDLPGGVGDAAQRTQQAAAGGPTEERGEHGGHERAEDQGGEDHRQRAFGVRQRERFEVAGVVGADVHADREVRIAVVVGEALLAGQPVGDGRHQLVGERLFAATDGDALAGAGQHREAAALDGEVLHPFSRVGRLVEHGDELGGVTVGLRLGRGGALVDERAAGERVRERREAEAGEHRDQPEEHRDPSAQAERTAIGHGDSVTRPRQVARIARNGRGRAAGEAPGGGRHPTGAA